LLDQKRIIKYRRKNRSNWDSVDADTISSVRVGVEEVNPLVRLIQFVPTPQILPVPQVRPVPRSEPVQQAAPFPLTGIDSYKNQEGLIQIDKLSSNKSLFQAFITAEKSVSSGGSFTVTLPTSELVAKLIQANQYEKYNKLDFVRARAQFFSTIFSDNGKPILQYQLAMQPNDPDSESTLNRLIEGGAIFYTINASDAFTKSEIFTSKEPHTFPNLKESIISTRSITDRTISLSPVRLDISFGKEARVASFTAFLYAPE
jgi:hypothetical protein